jgi:hypothetical protein
MGNCPIINLLRPRPSEPMHELRIKIAWVHIFKMKDRTQDMVLVLSTFEGARKGHYDDDNDSLDPATYRVHRTAEAR